jgi:vacuolar protein-sorting-associated protein 4
MIGCPGVGKTMAVSAFSSEIKAREFGVVYSLHSVNLISKYVDLRREVTALFEAAISAKLDFENGQKYIFIDEIDLLHDQEWLSEELEKLLEKGIILIGAANRPWTIHPVILKHFKLVCLPPPTLEERKVFLKRSSIVLAEPQLVSLAEKTEYFSFSDLTILIREAEMVPIRTASSAEHFRRLENGKLAPCEKSDAGAMQLCLKELNPDCVQLGGADFGIVLSSLERVKHSCSKEEFERIKEFRINV